MNPWELIIQQPMVNILIVLCSFLFNNFGLTIIALTVVIRGAMYPLTIKQLRSTQAMETLQPKLAELRKKYGRDQQKLAQEQAKLYRESGINPAGCLLPMLIQMPIWIALYQSIMLALAVAPEGSLKIDPANFYAFHEAVAISTSITMSTFAPGKAVHIVLATHMTPVCDCFGFTSMPIMRDAGIFGSNDIVAVDQAVLDASSKYPLIEENVPTSMEVHTRVGHPLRWLHGPLKDPYKATEYAEKVGLGSREYELVDVLPVESIQPAPMGYIPAK